MTGRGLEGISQIQFLFPIHPTATTHISTLDLSARQNCYKGTIFFIKGKVDQYSDKTSQHSDLKYTTKGSTDPDMECLNSTNSCVYTHECQKT